MVKNVDGSNIESSVVDWRFGKDEIIAANQYSMENFQVVAYSMISFMKRAEILLLKEVQG